jgi:hypothetical protein
MLQARYEHSSIPEQCGHALDVDLNGKFRAITLEGIHGHGP